MSEINQFIIDRVQKLINLSGDAAATPGESSVAMAKATEIMTKYMMTEADLNKADEKHDPFIGKKIYTKSHHEVWRRALVQAVNRSCGVFYLMYTSERCYEFFGRRSQVDVAEYMFVTFQAKILTAARKAYIAAYNDGSLATNRLDFVYRFKEAAAIGYAEAVKNRQTQMAADNSCTALVVVDNSIAEARNWAKDHGSNWHTSRSYSVGAENQASALGADFGRKLSSEGALQGNSSKGNLK